MTAEVFSGSMQALPQLETLRGLDRELPTPALIVHADIARANVARFAALTDAARVKLRPHAKSHKSDLLAGWQRDAGCVGLTVGTFEEAEYFLAAGHRDLFVACPPVGPGRAEALADLARRADVIVSVDGEVALARVDAVAAAAGRPIRYYWEMDAGFGRYGTPAGSATADAVREAQRFEHAVFAGLMNFGGRAYGVGDPHDVAKVSRAEAEQTVETAELIRKCGIDVPEVSVGSTPSAAAAIAVEGVTELRAGTYIFNDATQVALGSAGMSECAQTICTTVMSAQDGRVVVDAGSKALPKETMSRLTNGYGSVLGHPDLVIERVSEEASVLTWSPATGVDPADRPGVGDQLQLISNHCCSATYLFSHFWLVGAGLLDRLPIGARTR
ncbi:MAG TPA: alanine racemase [Micromonosporaceae bacterium]